MPFNIRRQYKNKFLLILYFFCISLYILYPPDCFPAIKFEKKWGSKGDADGQFSRPAGIVINSYGHIYVTDTENHRIQEFTPAGVFVKKWGADGTGNGQFHNPYDLAIGANDNIYVTDTENHRIQEFTADGSFLRKWGTNGNADGQFSSPYAIAIGPDNNVYVADTGNNRIQKFDSDGQFITKWSGEFSSPFGIAVDSSNNVYVADRDNSFIYVYDSNGAFIRKWGREVSYDGYFNPYRITMDSSDNVYVVDVPFQRIQEFTSTGTFIKRLASMGSGDGELSLPFDIAIDSANNIYLTDRDNNRVQMFKYYASSVSNAGKSGKVGGTIDITGTNLYTLGTLNVYFNNALAEILSNTDSLVKAKVPAGASSGTLKIVMDGIELSSSYFYLNPASIKPADGITKIISDDNFSTYLTIDPGILTKEVDITVSRDNSITDGIAYSIEMKEFNSNNIITELSDFVTVTIGYTIAGGKVANTDVLESEIDKKLAVFYYDKNKWLQLSCSIDTINKTISARTRHLSLFAIKSKYSSTVYDISKIGVYPNPFTPNGDNVNDSVGFYFDNSDNEEVNINIFNKRGKLVRKITGLNPRWDGKDEAGDIAESGVYIYQFKIKNENKNGVIILGK